MKILFITTDVEDYLSDSLLHGFRQLFGKDVTDFPKKYCMYKNYPSSQKLYGNGFTLYRTLDDLSTDRSQVFEKVKNQYFNLIIFSDIYRQYGYLYQLLPYLKKENTIICDGEDSTAIFPYRSFFYKKRYYRHMQKPHKKFLYYKREWTRNTVKSRWFNLPPEIFCGQILTPKNIRPISFSIPREKVIKGLPQKKKLFPDHIVDLEISKKIKNHSKYVFEDESSYYADLQSAKFGITTKRGGWDCMRHYEIAANGTVICFKDLEKKPATCAPHGLNKTNCIPYNNYNDLMGKINDLPQEKYQKLQKNAMQWVMQNTTIVKAQQLLDNFMNCQNISQYSNQIMP
ncbi:hypothetical protein MNBD_NITROSPIRAE01-677 [hydrothermal vent metagenome]|uniref:Glycosyltransferase family 1 protein n=1 Tax=hydrothermal vent metagenome TaxID=652676 RepID=A0A3B1D627_9ZZZZ